MDKIVQNFWKKWYAAYNTGDEDAMEKLVGGLIVAKTVATPKIPKHFVVSVMNSYFVDLVEFVESKKKPK